jgi:hypothetical protein
MRERARGPTWSCQLKVHIPLAGPRRKQHGRPLPIVDGLNKHPHGRDGEHTEMVGRRLVVLGSPREKWCVSTCVGVWKCVLTCVRVCVCVGGVGGGGGLFQNASLIIAPKVQFVALRLLESQDCVGNHMHAYPCLVDVCG